MNDNALGIIFSNMHDEALRDLTSQRTVASVPFGGRYRLIDFVLSNMYNSGITKVGVITKSNYQSLMDHLGSGKEWDLSRKREGLYILPPFGRLDSGVYKNRLEALSGIADFIRHSTNKYVILSDCDTIYNMDFNIPLECHIQKNADITVFYKRKEPDENGIRTGVVYSMDDDNRVTDIMLNSKVKSECNAGLNMWIMNKEFLEHVIDDAISHNLENFERDILQKRCDTYRIYGWEFDGYVGKIDSMRSFFDVNMDILNYKIRQELFYKYGHIYTKVRDEVPVKYGTDAKVSNSLIADGCIIEGEVENSIIFRGVYVGKGTKISNSIIMQGNRVENNVKLNYVITDKNVNVKNNRVIMGCDTYPTYIAKNKIV